jgi:hypothetical protein
VKLLKEIFYSPLLSNYQWSMLFFVVIIFLPECQAEEIWKLSNKIMLFLLSGRIIHKSTLILSPLPLGCTACYLSIHPKINFKIYAQMYLLWRYQYVFILQIYKYKIQNLVQMLNFFPLRHTQTSHMTWQSLFHFFQPTFTFHRRSAWEYSKQ